MIQMGGARERLLGGNLQRNLAILLFVATLVQPVQSRAEGVLNDLETLVNIADKIGIIEPLKQKLISQPDPASEKLVVVLEEISKIYTSLDSELSSYLAIHYYNQMSNDEKRGAMKQLLDLEGGRAMTRVAEARGHSSKIKNIYEKFLQGWFNRVLDQQEVRSTRDLFDALLYLDMNMVAAMENVSLWLADKAHITLNHVNAGDFKAANTTIATARTEIFDQRRRMAEVLILLRKLQADFIMK